MAPRWLEIVERVAPMAMSMIPGPPAILAPFVAKGIAIAHSAGGDNASKLAKARASVINAIEAYNGLEGHERIDVVLTSGAIDNAISATVQMAKVVEKAQAPNYAETTLAGTTN